MLNRARRNTDGYVMRQRIEAVPIGGVFSHNGLKLYKPHARPRQPGFVFAIRVKLESGTTSRSAPRRWMAFRRGTIVDRQPGEKVKPRASVHP